MTEVTCNKAVIDEILYCSAITQSGEKCKMMRMKQCCDQSLCYKHRKLHYKSLYNMNFSDCINRQLLDRKINPHHVIIEDLRKLPGLSWLNQKESIFDQHYFSESFRSKHNLKIEKINLAKQARDHEERLRRENKNLDEELKNAQKNRKRIAESYDLTEGEVSAIFDEPFSGDQYEKDGFVVSEASDDETEDTTDNTTDSDYHGSEGDNEESEDQISEDEEAEEDNVGIHLGGGVVYVPVDYGSSETSSKKKNSITTNLESPENFNDILSARDCQKIMSSVINFFTEVGIIGGVQFTDSEIDRNYGVILKSIQRKHDYRHKPY